LTEQTVTKSKGDVDNGVKKDYLANFLEEWKACRAVFKDFDERLHDIRKYGFTFITGLLTVEALLIPAGSKPESIPDLIKFAVLCASLILITVLHCIDKGYRLFGKLTMNRARVLERRLNLELSEIISSRSIRSFSEKVIPGIYCCYAVVVVLFGWAILASSDAFWIYIIILGIGPFAATYLPHKIVPFYEHGKEDWSIFPLEIRKGDWLRVTLTNLDEDTPIIFKKGVIIFTIRRQSQTSPEKQIKAEDDAIGVENSYTWLLNRDELPTLPGIYRIYIRAREGEEEKTKRKKQPEPEVPEPEERTFPQEIWLR
jgi:hypothetical protein